MGIELVRLTKTRPERFGKVVNTVELPISNHSVIEVHTKESPSTNNEHHPAANKTHMTMVFRLVLNIYTNIGLNKVAVGIRILPFFKEKDVPTLRTCHHPGACSGNGPNGCCPADGITLK